ncbi:hypothetical protein EMIT0158MI4_70125 [Burkholderia ambifaria]
MPFSCRPLPKRTRTACAISITTTIACATGCTKQGFPGAAPGRFHRSGKSGEDHEKNDVDRRACGRRGAVDRCVRAGSGQRAGGHDRSVQGRVVLFGRVEEGCMRGSQGREDLVRRIGCCGGQRTGRGARNGGIRYSGIGPRARQERAGDDRGSAWRRRGPGVGQRQHEGLSLLDRQVLRQDEARQLHVGSGGEDEGLPCIARQGLFVTQAGRAGSLARASAERCWKSRPAPTAGRFICNAGEYRAARLQRA